MQRSLAPVRWYGRILVDSQEKFGNTFPAEGADFKQIYADKQPKKFAFICSATAYSAGTINSKLITKRLKMLKMFFCVLL